MANIKGAGAAEFAAGMYGVREANLANRKAEQDIEFAQAREDRAAAEAEANRSLADRQEDRLLRNLELQEDKFALEQEKANVSMQLTRAQAEESRFKLNSLREAQASMGEIRSASLTQALQETKPDFLSMAGEDLWEQMQTLIQKRERLSMQGGDVTAVDNAIATLYGQYKTQSIADGRAVQARALLGAIGQVYEQGLGEQVPAEITQLTEELGFPAANGVSGATQSGQLASDTLISKLQRQLEHAQGMVESRRDRQFILDLSQNLMDEARPLLKKAQLIAKNNGKGGLTYADRTDEVQEWFNSVYQLQTDIQASNGSDRSALMQRLQELRTRAGMLTANEGDGAVLMQRDRAKRTADRIAFEEEYRNFELFSAIADVGDTTRLGALSDLIGQMGGQVMFDRDGGLFDPTFGDTLGTLTPDMFAALNSVKKRANTLWADVPSQQRTAKKLQEVRRQAVLDVDREMTEARDLRRSAEVEAEKGDSRAEKTEAAVRKHREVYGDQQPFSPAPGSDVSRSVIAVEEGFRGNYDDGGRPERAFLRNASGTGLGVGPQAYQRSEAAYDPELKSLVPVGNSAEAGVIAALISMGYVQAYDTDYDPSGRSNLPDDDFKLLDDSARFGREDRKTYDGGRRGVWVFTEKAQRVFAAAGDEGIDVLMESLGDRRAAVLDWADKYKPIPKKDRTPVISFFERAQGMLADGAQQRAERSWYSGLPTSAQRRSKRTSQPTKLPGSYPKVSNPDGTESNVMLATFEIDGRHYAIPTMVNGKRLQPMQALQFAEEKGLSRYPSFATAEEANKWVSANHGNITGTDD